jgi:polysaccharide biosynthesis/export protein
MFTTERQKTSVPRGAICPPALALLLFAVLCQVGVAQQPMAQPASSPPPAAPSADGATPAPTPAEYRYRIGPGDILDIRIFGRTDFSREAVVDTRGYIRMPLVKDEIKAACHTEEEFAADIAAIYKKYLKDPHVDVFVKQYNSEPVAVIGAVNSPSRFQLQRPVRLLELIVAAGGPSIRAGRTIQLVHSAQGLAQSCDSAGTSVEGNDTGMIYFQLTSTLKADDKNNPFMRPGDLINIPDSDQAYVVGNVRNPTAVSLNEPTTLSRALGMAGGILPDTQKGKVRILRQPPGTTVQTEVYVDLAAIEKKLAPDEPLYPNDIVEIPTKTGFLPSLRRMATQGVLPILTQLPLRMIP